MTRLSDVVQMTFGFAFKSRDFTEKEDDIRLLRGDNVAQGRLRWEGVKHFSPVNVDDYEKFMLDVGDVVIAMDRPWIPAGLKWSVVRESDVPALLVQRVARLRSSNAALDQGFLAAVIGSKPFTDYVIGVQTGSAVPHISGRQIGDFEFRLPHLEEQRAIAATLGALDDKIESNRRATLSTNELVDAIAEKLGEELPSVELRSIATLRKETAKPSTMGGEVVAHYSLPAFDDGGKPDLVAASTIMSNKSWIRADSVLVSRLNPRINRSWWVQRIEDVASMASTEFAVLEPAVGATLAGVWLAIRDPFFRNELPRRVTGTSGSHQRVRPEDMLSIEVPDVRQAAGDLLDQVRELMARAQQLKEESAKLAALRDALLPELLSGRIRATSEELVSA